MERRLGRRPPQSRARRRGGMDLEPCRFTLSRRHSDRRPLPCSRTSLEVSSRPTPHDQVQQKRWMMYHQNRLDKGRIEKLVRSLRSLEGRDPELPEAIRIEANYFERNATRMRYPKFRQQHLFVGSGVIEAGCNTIIGSRTKQSGMFWTVRGASAIITLPCCQLNGRFEDYWEARRA